MSLFTYKIFNKFTSHRDITIVYIIVHNKYSRTPILKKR